MKNLIIIFIVCGCLFAGCKIFGGRHATNYTYSVGFGSTGGFTGATEEYILRDNGLILFAKPLSKDTAEIKTLDKDQTKSVFKTLASPEFEKIHFNEIGNLTYFINYYRDKKFIRSYQWNDASIAPKEVKELYDRLMSHAKKN